jgi:carbamoyl-phosphate synthase large subunit
MRAVGEVMSIGKNYKEDFQKSIRSLENGRHGLGFAKDFNAKTLAELLLMLAEPTSERQFVMYEALRKGATVEQLFKLTHIKHWFIQQMKELVELEEEILKHKGQALPDDLLVRAKKDGFADKYLAKLLGIPEKSIREQRKQLGVVEGWHAVPVSGVENAAYYYSSYNAKDTAPASKNPKKIMILGGGPNRIGQGIEFDYCCVHAAMALRAAGYETIMVNCNPETVSTDYDTSDKLYFEPLTVEDVLAIYDKENEAQAAGDPALRCHGIGLPLSTSCPRSIRCSAPRYARPARCWAWPRASAKPSSRPKRRPSHACPPRARCSSA